MEVSNISTYKAKRRLDLFIDFVINKLTKLDDEFFGW